MTFCIIAMGLTLALADDGAIGQGRELGGHRFAVPVDLDHPFTVPFIAFRQGVQYGAYPAYRYPGVPEPLSLQVAGLSETLRAQVRIGPRWALNATASGGLQAGVNAGSAFFSGVRGGVELRAGARVRVHRSQRVQLAVGAGVRRHDTVGVVPAHLAVAALDDPTSTLPDLLSGRWADALLVRERRTQVTGSLSAAIALSPAVGLVAAWSAQAGPLRVDATEVQTWTASTGLGASLDLRLPRGPWGLTVGVRSRLEQDLELERGLGVGLGAIGVTQLYYDRGGVQLGLVATGSVWRPITSASTLLQVGVDGRATVFF